MTRSTTMPATAAGDQHVAQYLQRLERAAADLPDGPRDDLLDQIRSHLAETVGPDADEAHVRSVLDDLGTPEQVAAAARAEHGVRPGRSQSELSYDVATIVVLLLGGFVVPVVGWVAGVIMLWAGPRWTRGQKWFGTAIWPLGLLAPVAMVVLALVLGALPAHSGVLGTAAIIALALLALLAVVAFVGGFVYLARAARRP